MSAVNVLGIIITVIGVAYNVPFTWRVWRTKSAKDIDPSFLALRIVNSILTIAYGALLEDIYIITTNAIPLLSSIVVLGIRYRFSGVAPTPDDDAIGLLPPPDTVVDFDSKSLFEEHRSTP
jgi:uncharacterized protein with PQ loop repeat